MIRFNNTRGSLRTLGVRGAKLIAAMAVLAGWMSASAGTIDCFDGPISLNDSGPPAASGGVAAPCAVGGARFMYLVLGTPSTPTTLTTDDSGSGHLDLVGKRGGVVFWTGAEDGSYSPGLDLDLTNGGTTDRIRVWARANTNTSFAFKIYSETPSSNYLLGSGNLVGATGIGSGFVPIDVPFSSLMANGSGASLTSVKVLWLEFRHSLDVQVGEPQLQIDLIETVGQGDVPEPATQGVLGVVLIAAVMIYRRRSDCGE